MSEWVHLDVEEIVRETEKAFHVLLDGGELVWVPKSVVADSTDYKNGDSNCTVSVAS